MNRPERSWLIAAATTFALGACSDKGKGSAGGGSEEPDIAIGSDCESACEPELWTCLGDGSALPCVLDVTTGCYDLGEAVLCDDDNACTGDECQPGGCAHPPVVCNDDNLCNGVESCEPDHGCIEGTPLGCSDGLECTGTETCDPLAGCGPGQPPAGCCESAADCDDEANPCNGFGACETSTGTCKIAAALVCDDKNVCNGFELCDPASQGCLTVPPEPCDDDNVCNGLESCDPHKGCEPGTQLLCDDGLPCNGLEVCDESAGCLIGDPLQGCCLGLADCEDGNGCNGLGSCDTGTGTCAVVPPEPCDDGNLCNGIESCDPASGCSSTGALTCSDGNPCNGEEVCDQALGCVVGSMEPCEDDDVCNGLSSCAPLVGCVDGEPLACTDEEPCNGEETCDPAIGCIAGEVIACDDGDACTEDKCIDGGEGCDHPSVECDDEDACTVEHCDEVEGCVYALVDCADDNACEPLTGCSPEEGCLYGAIGCDDGDPCTSDGCDPAAGCIALSEGCDDGDPCTDELCVEGDGCVEDPEACDDEDPCTDDLCVEGEGCSYSAVVCEGADECEVVDCAPGNGCELVEILDCDDDDACTEDQCEAGGCVHDPLDCDDGSVCTDDDCTQDNGCVNLPVDCEDDDDCTEDECHDPDGCTHSPVVCDDGNACTLDGCDPIDGCTAQEVECGDEDDCTEDLCEDPELGCEFVAVSCDDQDDCTVDGCEPGVGCVYEPLPCADEDPCTVSSCQGGDCVHVVDCDDDDPCTEDTCEDGVGCVHPPADCEDGEPCTVHDCDPGSGCTSGLNPCDDEDPCTIDACIPGVGCAPFPDDCDDGAACTADDCSPAEGGCFGVGIDCADAEACSVDGCDPELGCTYEDLICDDGLPCTEDDCDDELGCLVGPDDCDDGDACTTDTCGGEGCEYEEVVCDDGDACTDELCSAGSGCSWSFVPCDDGNPCTLDSCADEGGQPVCVGDPNPACVQEAFVWDLEVPWDYEFPALISLGGGVATLASLPPGPLDEGEAHESLAALLHLDLDLASIADLESHWAFERTAWSTGPGEVLDTWGSAHGARSAAAESEPRGLEGRALGLARQESVSVPGAWDPAGNDLAVTAWFRAGPTHRQTVGPLVGSWTWNETLEDEDAELIDAGAVGGLSTKRFQGGVFDGRWIWFVGNKADPQLMRYDTHGDFADLDGSWEATSLGSLPGPPVFNGAAFDGRWIYPVAELGNLGVRYDTSCASPLGDAACIESVDVSLVDALTPGETRGAVSDGRYVWYAASGGLVFTRYDSEGAFDDLTSWARFDITGLPGLVEEGWRGALFDGRYVYFVSSRGGVAANNPIMLRLDSRGAFRDPGSWEAVDVQDLTGFGANGHWGGAFDGRYLYFPAYGFNSRSDRILRYDTLGAFDAEASWTEVSAISKTGSTTRGFLGATFDGRYLWVVPHRLTKSANTEHGRVVRYDTLGDFEANSSWSILDLDLTFPGGGAKGFLGAVFDGGWVYLVPSFADSAEHGRVVRIRAAEEGSWRLWAGFPPAGGVSGGPVGPAASIVGAARAWSSMASEALGAGWHSLVLSRESSGSTTLFVDGAGSAAVLAEGVTLAAPLRLGGESLEGSLDEVHQYSRPVDEVEAGDRFALNVEDSGSGLSNGFPGETGRAGGGAHGLGQSLAASGSAERITIDKSAFGAGGSLTAEAWLEVPADGRPIAGPIVDQWNQDPTPDDGDFDAVDLVALLGPGSGGFSGGTFDGRYVYLSPYNDTTFVRFDTHLSESALADAGRWESVDLLSGQYGELCRHRGATFDGRAVWLVPNSCNSGPARFVRYDTQGDFSDINASYGVLHPEAAQGTYTDAAFDGRYVYSAPKGHGLALRIDTTSDVLMQGSFETVNLTDAIIPGPPGFLAVEAGGDHVYFVGGVDAGGYTGRISRFWIGEAFDDLGAWSHLRFDNVGGVPVGGFSCAAFDGRYLFLGPGEDETIWGRVVRFDTRAELHDPGALSVYEAATSSTWSDVVFDGRTISLIPERGSTTLVRYDTRDPFTDPASWSEITQESNSGLTTVGYEGAVFDGRYLHLVPFGGPEYGWHGNLLRYDGKVPLGRFALYAGMQDGPRGPTGIVAGPTGEHGVVSHPEALEPGWHHVALTLDEGAGEVTLYVDGTVADVRSFPAGLDAAGSSLDVADRPLAIPIDEVALWTSARPADEIAARAAGTATTVQAVAARIPAAASGTIAGWLGFSAEATTPDGTSVTYQLSIDGGSTFLYPDDAGTWLVGELELAQSASAGDLDTWLATLPVLDDALVVRALLRSDDRASTPTLDSVSIHMEVLP